MSIFSNFSGGEDRRARRKAISTLQGGQDNALAALQGGYDTAQGYLEPYQDQGESLDFYDSLLAGDPDAVEQFHGNPLFDQQLQNQQNALLRNLNARGMSGSGAGALAAARVNQDDTYRRLGLYGNRAQMGGQFAGQAAGLASGLGQQQAGVYQNTANAISGNQAAMGQTYNTGMNNLLNIAGAGLKGFSLFNRTPTGRV